jgi:hypothetical protein
MVGTTGEAGFGAGGALGATAGETSDGLLALTAGLISAAGWQQEGIATG